MGITCYENKISILNPELLRISDGSALGTGANQNWYKTRVRRNSGCGPTAAANMMHYLSLSRPDYCQSLANCDSHTRQGMQVLMDHMWDHITPGPIGVYTPEAFAAGAERFAGERGVSIKTKLLKFPPKPARRPDSKTTLDFLNNALRCDIPVAFLNLSNGDLENLSSWHWVTLLSVDKKLSATVCDYGRSRAVDLNLWLDTATMGGAFVALE